MFSFVAFICHLLGLGFYKMRRCFCFILDTILYTYIPAGQKIIFSSHGALLEREQRHEWSLEQFNCNPMWLLNNGIDIYVAIPGSYALYPADPNGYTAVIVSLTSTRRASARRIT
jgi:hypothetical protein